jgi:hypothetical protein
MHDHQGVSVRAISTRGRISALCDHGVNPRRLRFLVLLMCRLEGGLWDAASARPMAMPFLNADDTIVFMLDPPGQV